MKPIPILTLALVCALCAFSAPPAHAQIGTTCTITGTIYQRDGRTPAAGATLTVTRVDRQGTLFTNVSQTIPYKANSNGVVTFRVPRTIGTDTSIIRIKADFGNLAQEQILYVPSDSTATLESLVRYTANPQFVVVAVPTSVDDSTQTIFNPAGTQKIPASRLDVGAITGDTTGTTNQPAFGRFENALGQFTAGTSDSIQQTAASVFVARNVAEGKADADSMKLAFDRLGDRADADSLASVKTTADGAVQKADTNALHAQKFRIIDNRFGDRADADSLASVKSTADAALPKADTSALHAQRFADITTSLASKLQWTDTTGFFSRYGGVMAETDPTALAKASSALDSSLSGGTRSISTTGRMFASDDSITFVGEAGDVIDARLGNVFRGTLSANDTLSITGMVDGQVITIIVTNAGTNTLGWTGVNWAGGTVPTLSATANKRDAFTIIRAGGIMYGSAVQDLR